MKIYFAGSIRGGREDQAIYEAILTLLREHAEVLTEHVAAATLTEKGEDGPNDRYIHDRDMAWLTAAHAVVAEVTTPSLGVGYELGRAVESRKPILALFRNDSPRILSAMIAGCPHITTIRYSHPTDLREPLQTFLQSLPSHGG